MAYDEQVPNWFGALSDNRTLQSRQIGQGIQILPRNAAPLRGPAIQVRQFRPKESCL
jgi:hypothetical protein